jgi:hypothetical protein
MSVETCNTPLAALARERDWQICYCDEDGTGVVEMSPGVFLEIEPCGVPGEDAFGGWIVAVKFDTHNLPVSPLALSTGLGKALHNVALKILDVSDDEITEARKEIASADEG